MYEGQRRKALRDMAPYLVGYLTSFAAQAGTGGIDDTVEQLAVMLDRYGRESRLSFEERVSRRKEGVSSAMTTEPDDERGVDVVIRTVLRLLRGDDDQGAGLGADCGILPSLDRRACRRALLDQGPGGPTAGLCGAT